MMRNNWLKRWMSVPTCHQRQRQASRTRPHLELLEDRLAPATVTDNAATLMINLGANEQLSLVSNGSTYTFGVNNPNTFTTPGVASASDFSAFNANSLTLQASGLARYDTIQVTDSAAGASVVFNNSGANSFSDNINITLDSGAGTTAAELDGQVSFSGTAGLNLHVDNTIYIPAAVSLASGSIILNASSATGQGVQISGGGKITSTDGPISITGATASNNGGAAGILLGSGALIHAFGAGSGATVTLEGANTGVGAAIATQEGVQVTSVGGALTLEGTASGNAAVYLTGGTTQVSSSAAAISIKGTTTSSNGGHYGTYLLGGVTVSATGSAAANTVTVQGTSTGGGIGLVVDQGARVTSVGGAIDVTGMAANSHGLAVVGATTTITSSAAPVSVTGTTASANGGHYGVYLTQGGTVSATGSVAENTVTVQGTSTGGGVGLLLDQGAKVTSMGGNIDVTGTAAHSHGVALVGAGIQVASSDAGISITGTTVGSSAGIYAVLFQQGPEVSGATTVTIQGTNTGLGNGIEVFSGATVTSTDGGLSLTGEGKQSGIFLEAGTAVSAAGAVTFAGTGTTSHGVYINGAGTQVASTSGPISISGTTASTTGGQVGVYIHSGAVVSASGAGVGATVTLEGTSTGNSQGLVIDAGSHVTSVGGGIDLTGMAVNNYGIFVTGAGTLVSSAGAITMTGTSTNYVGVDIDQGAVISSTATGPDAPGIHLEGTTNSTGVLPALAVNNGASVTAVDGDISLQGTHNLTGNRPAVEISGGKVSSTGTGADAATITLTGMAPNGATGVGLLNNAQITSVAGAITITGTARNAGVSLSDGSLVQATSSGAVQITATASPLLLQNATVQGAEMVTLQATDTAAFWRENITLQDTTVTSTGDAVILSAGDTISIDAQSTVTAAGSLGLLGDIPAATDLDPGFGTHIDVRGQLNSPNILVTGSADPDGFKITPSLTSAITVLGDAPAAPTLLGDGLMILTPAGEMSTLMPTGADSGVWSTTGGYQNVTFSQIEPLQALNLVVTTRDDIVDLNDGVLSLREAIQWADIYPAADTITFDPALNGQTILVSEGALPLYGIGPESLTTITGPGADLLRISGTGVNQIFHINTDVQAEINGLTLMQGNATSDDVSEGGAIYNAGVLTVNDCTFTDNTASSYGGAIFSGGTLTINHSSFLGNSSYYGGAIYNSYGTLTVSNSLIQGNTSEDGYGGGIYSEYGTLLVTGSTISGNTGADGAYGGGLVTYDSTATISNSTISGNRAGGYGGGIYNGSDSLTVSNSTISDNISGNGYYGGGIYNESYLYISNSTISGNRADYGGGIYSDAYVTRLWNVTVTGNRGDSDGGGLYDDYSSSVFDLFNTIVAGNFVGASGTTANDLGGYAVDNAIHNLIGDVDTAGGVTNGDNGNLVGVNGVGTRDIATILDTVLRDNGGPTLTHALVAGSAALNAGDNDLALDADGTTPLAFDQRGTGFDRINAIAVDMGAFEVQLGSISGRKWHDLDADGQHDASEPYLNGWTIELIDQSGSVLATDVTHTVSGQDGWYSFPDLVPGPYVVREVLQPDWYQSYPTFPTTFVAGSVSGVWDWDSNDGNGHPGPDAWDTVAPDADGFFQSPVDLSGPTVDLSTVLDTHYNPTVVEKVFNNGHTIEALYNASPDNRLEIGGEDFELEQFHFHAASEHSINGVQEALELHLVHQHADGGLAVIGIFLHEDATAPDNPAFAAVFSQLVNLQNNGDEVFPSTPLDAAALFPASTQGWFYEGSLTTPPASQPVNWFVFSTAVVISKAQADAYRAAADYDPDHDFFPGNRPVQPLNGRQLNEINHEVTLLSGAAQTTVNFGNYQLSTISGRQWDDLVADGEHEAGEPYLNGWTIELINRDGQVVGADVTHTVSGQDGWYSFPDLVPGPYVVHAVVPAGWVQTAPGAITQLTLGSVSGPWDYDSNDGNALPGPDQWDTVATDVTGDFQSPINLTGPTVDLSQVVDRHYEPTVVEKVFNNGHTVEALYNGSPANEVEIGGEEFELEQFHFHSSSEHAIDGQLFDMELHLVHQHADGGLTVLGVLLQANPDSNAPDNPAFAAIFNQLVNLQHSGDEVFPSTPIDAATLFPADNSGYFYQGSLTTPPGTEGVNWFVFKTPVLLSQAQIAAYRAVADSDPNHDFFPGNRPLQALNGRRLNQFNHEITLQSAAALIDRDFGAYEVAAGNYVVDQNSDVDDSVYTINHLSLREAVKLANGHPGADTITFAAALAGQMIPLDLGALVLSDDVTITGPTAGITLDGNHGAGIFVINSEVTAGLSHLTLTHSNNIGIFNQGTLTLTDSTITENSAAFGGGIDNFGMLTMTRTTVAGNTASSAGGGIYNAGTLKMTDSTVSGNSTTGNGGGIYNEATGTLAISNSTISGNQATGHGGGIDSRGTLTTHNVTVTGNRADSDGNASGMGGGIYKGTTSVATLYNTLVAGNLVGTDSTRSDLGILVMTGAPFTGGYNLIGDTGSAGGLQHGSNGNIVGNNGTGFIPITEILNTTLALNGGGPTKTHALTPNSRAINAGNTALALDVDDLTALMFDQRGNGFPRTKGPAVDIGAYEMQNQAPTGIMLSGSSSVTENATNGTLIGTLSATDPDMGDTFTFCLVNDAGGRFKIVGAQLQVKTGSLLDFESNTSHTIRVKVTDAAGATFEKDFTILVLNQIVTGMAQTFNLQPNTPFSAPAGTLLQGSFSSSGQPRQVSAVEQPTIGTVTWNSNGSFSWTPPTNFSGMVTFRVRLTDGQEISDWITITLNVAPPPAATVLSRRAR